jgi:hypothetical protein
LLERERAIRQRAGGEQHPDFADCLSELGSDLACCLVMNFLTYGDVQLAAGDQQLHHHAQRAEAVLNEALELLERIPDGRRLPGYSRVICNLSLLHYWTDYRLKGRAAVRKLVDAARASIALHPTLPELHPVYPFWLVEKASLAEAAGDAATADEALAELRRVVAQIYGEQHIYFTALANLNTTCHYARHGDWARLAPAAERAFAHWQATLRLSTLSDRACIEWLNIIHRPLSEYVLLAAQQPRFDALRVYGEVLAHRGALGRLQAMMRLAHDRPEIRPRLLALRSTRAAFVGHALTVPSTSDSTWHDKLTLVTDAKEDAETDLLLACRQHVTWPKHDPAALVRAVQQALPEGTVLLDFVKLKQALPFGPGQGAYRWKMVLVAFVVQRDRPPTLVRLGPLAPIKEAVSAWRRELQGRGAGERKTAAGVAERLWAPLSHHLGKARTILVAPDGPVWLTPFAALPGTKPGTYLLEEYSIGWLPSARFLADPPAQAPAPAHGVVAVGGVAYGGGRGPMLLRWRAARAWCTSPGTASFSTPRRCRGRPPRLIWRRRWRRRSGWHLAATPCSARG